MDIPLQIVFPDFPLSNAVRLRVRQRVNKLAKRYGRMTGCYVNIGNNSRKRHKGNLFYVTVELYLPGEKLVYSRSHDSENMAHTNVYVALRDAFNAIERQLQDSLVQKRIRLHTAVPQQGSEYGHVVRLVLEAPGEGYGFLQKDAEDEREFYFNSHSVLNHGFEEIKVGSRVRFAEEQGEEGPQASTVELIAA